MQYAFYFNQDRCMGCNTCIVACKDWKDIKPGKVSLRRSDLIEIGDSFETFQEKHLVYSCNHCAEPACMDACPSKAISKDKDTGTTIVDLNICAGLGNCVTACPYGAAQLCDDKQEPNTVHKLKKCDMCVDRLQEGLAPVCVLACPQRAIDAGPEDYIKTKYQNITRGIPGIDNNKTMPNIYIQLK